MSGIVDLEERRAGFRDLLLSDDPIIKAAVAMCREYDDRTGYGIAVGPLRVVLDAVREAGLLDGGDDA
jgi:hypothetical protein